MSESSELIADRHDVLRTLLTTTTEAASFVVSYVFLDNYGPLGIETSAHTQPSASEGWRRKTLAGGPPGTIILFAGIQLMAGQPTHSTTLNKRPAFCILPKPSEYRLKKPKLTC